VIGRSLYADGNNPGAAIYSGIDVHRYRFWFFTINGTLSGLAAAFLLIVAIATPLVVKEIAGRRRA
jgi:ribose/xylose/arabinose/galactoside ABC-type transport system permease subunit